MDKPFAMAAPDPPADPIEFQFFNEIGIIAQLSAARLQARLPGGMPLAQFHVLNHFARLGGERAMHRLADAFQITRGAMTNTVTRLAEKRFVTVRRDPDDGRGKLVSLTPAGRAARDAGVSAMGAEIAALRAAFPAAMYEQTLPVLRALRHWLDSNR